MKQTILFLLIPFSLSAQVKGVVLDSISGKPVAYANIWVENENIGTTSDENGTFSLDIKEKKNIVFSALGYETKTLKSTKIENVSLVQKVYELAEVVLEIPKQTKEIEIGNSKKRFYLPEPQLVPWLFGRKFNLEENFEELKYVKEIIFYTTSEVENGIFRARVYEVKEEGIPGEDLISDEILVKVKKGKNKSVIDISRYNIEIPKEGIAVVFESLIVEQNKYMQEVVSLNPKKKYKILNYAPHIMYFHDDLIENYNFRSGKWMYFSKEYKEKIKGSYNVPIPAINLTLTN